MATLREQLRATTEAAIRLYEEFFEWNGRSPIPCVRRDAPTTLELQEYGGLIEHVSYFLDVPKTLFPGDVFPQIGDGINRNAHQIKAITGHKNPASPSIALALGSFDE